MKKVIPEPPQDRKDLLLATLSNPEAIVWLGVLIFGAATTGYFLIGVGALLGLLPVLGLLGYCFFSRRRR